MVSEHIPHIESFSLGFWFNVGTRDESHNTNGISHFVEHMVFKGTRKRSARKISETIEACGGYLNAFTSKENTCYYSRGLANRFETTFDVIADMVKEPLFRSTDIKKESGVILDELMDIEDNPEELIFDRFEEIIFRGNTLAYPIIGRQETISSFNRDNLLDFHKNYYESGRLLITASGKLNHEKVLKLSEKFFADKRTVSPLKRLSIKPVKPENQVFTKDINQVHCIIGTRSYGYKDPKRVHLSLLSVLLGEGSSSRLFQAVREKKGITYQINTFVNSYYDASAFGIYFSTSERNLDKAVSVIRNELDKMLGSHVPIKELNRVKEYLKGTIILGLENTTNRMMRLANNILYHNRIISLEEIIRKIESVTPDDIMNIAKEVLLAEKLTTVIIRSDKNKIIKAA